MRTTLTLDDDVAARIRAEMRKTGKSMRETVNESLRQILPPKRKGNGKRARLRTFDMGHYPSLDYDNAGKLLEQLDGPAHR